MIFAECTPIVLTTLSDSNMNADAATTMEPVKFKYAMIDPNATEPRKAHPYDAGFDLAACESGVVPPRGQLMINTGIVIHMPTDCYARVAPRSGLAYKKSIDVMAGVVDHGYSDSVRVILRNHADEPFVVSVGDRIAQLIFERIYTPAKLEWVTYNDIIDANSENNSTRGTNGYGSSGVSANVTV